MQEPARCCERRQRLSSYLANAAAVCFLLAITSPTATTAQYVGCPSVNEKYVASGNQHPILVENNITLIKFDHEDPRCHRFMSNGKEDRLGSQLHGRLSVFAFVHYQNLVHKSKVQYVHAPVSWAPASCCYEVRRDGAEYQRVDDMFGVGLGELSYLNLKNEVVCVASNCENAERHLGAGNLYYPSLLLLRRKFYSTAVERPPLPWFRPDHVNVFMHIRRGDIAKNKSPSRWTEMDINLNWLDMIKHTLQVEHGFKLVLHVASEGEADDFALLTEAHPELTLDLNGPLDAALYGMAVADVFFMAKSSFSFVPAIFNEGIVVVQKWIGSALPHWFPALDLEELTENFMLESTKQLLGTRIRNRMLGQDYQANSTASSIEEE